MTGTTLVRAARAERAAYLETLEALVEQESPSEDTAALERLADWLHARLRSDGWTVEPQAGAFLGDQLVARIGNGDGDEERSSTLLLCHYDTVYPVGTLASMPFRTDGDLAYGPGALDMKGGIALALHAVRLSARLGLALTGPVTLLLTSDEETGSHRSRERIERLASRSGRVLVLEPGRDDGALKTGRKGVGALHYSLLGRSAHAGNDPAAGASALAELARLLPYVEGLADAQRGTTVNLTMAAGGSASNVIAERAEATVDVRVRSAAEADRVETAARAYLPTDPRVTVTMTGGLNRPPLEATPGNEALYAEARTAGEMLGLELHGASVGGGSDGSFTSALGVPTLDGLGAVGAGPHARHEHLRMGPTLERLALLTALLTVS